MDKKAVKEALEKLRKNSKKLKFNQSVDLVISFSGLNLKNASHQVDFYVNLHKTRGRKIKICALVGPELKEDAAKVCDKAILADDFSKFQNNKAAQKKLAEEFDYFIAQADIMAKIAQTFGRILGTRGKMPNPKAGCVVPKKANLQPLYDRLQKLLRVQVKKEPALKISVAKEDTDDDTIIDNIMIIYDQLIHHLPSEEHNVKIVQLKFTMSKPVRIR